jgi:hypothetical protein
MEPHSSPAAGRGPFVLDVARIALGVFIGGLAALFAHDAIVGPQPSAPPPPPPPAVSMPSKPVGQDSGGTGTASGNTGTQAAAPPLPAQTEPPSPPRPAPPAPPQAEAPPPAAQPAPAAQDPAPKKADDDLRTAQALAARLEAERQQRRADAWARYFQPSPVCRADPTTRPCADAHLAARKRFDAQYVDR